MGGWDFWTHGSSVQVEYPQVVKFIRRTGYGTVVRQSEKTSNWFHFAIPTPTTIDDDYTVKHYDVFLKGIVNENAKIAKVHVWDGDSRRYKNDNLSIIGKKFDEKFNIPDNEVNRGLVVCVFVEFLSGTPMGEVRFISAGAKFHT
jgi:hypothetical protein